MQRVPPEPVQSSLHPTLFHHSAAHPAHHPQHTATPTGQLPPPANVDALVAQIQREFPGAAIRVTGRGRTVQRQAELMAERRRGNRQQFLRTYVPAHHIIEMDRWVTQHPHASAQDTTTAFVDIINRARQHGAAVSNHLSDRARDVSIPLGGHNLRDSIRHRMRQLGAHVIDEHDAVGGPHWHVDY